MAGVPDDRAPEAGPWPLGMNNVAKEGKQPTDQNGRVASVREADNLDFDDAGWPQTRAGRGEVFAGTLTHSLWSHDELTFGLFVDDGVLQVFRGPSDTGSLGLVVGGMPLSYVLVNDRIYFSNRTTCGLVGPDMAVVPWAPPTPDGQPALAAVDGFGLRAGAYFVAITFVDSLGRESGAHEPVHVTIDAQHGIHVTGIPQPAAGADVELVRLYVSPPDDGVLYRYATLPVGTLEAFITGDATGKALTTRGLRDMPPCQYLTLLNGRLVGASGRDLIWSEALRYGSYHPVRNRVHFSEQIDMVVAVGKGPGAGLFVAAGKRTYWLPAVVGEDQKVSFGLDIAQAAGVVPGTVMVLPNEKLGVETAGESAVWLSRRGTFCIGSPGGAVRPLKVDQIAMNSADRGAVMFREEGGINRFVAALKGPRRNGLAVSDRAIAHVIHQDP